MNNSKGTGIIGLAVCVVISVWACGWWYGKDAVVESKPEPPAVIVEPAIVPQPDPVVEPAVEEPTEEPQQAIGRRRIGRRR